MVELSSVSCGLKIRGRVQKSKSGQLPKPQNMFAVGIPDICHGSHGYIRGEKICHVEKFQISMHDRCGEF